MIAPRRVAHGHEIAAMLGCKPRSFARRLPALQAAGFPAPLPGLGQRWDIQAVEAWLNAQSPAPAASAIGAEAVLIERAAAMAAA